MRQNLPKGLYLVATPIGNLFDMTVRALHVLEQAHGIAAEDTRHTQILLRTYGISKPLWPYHEHNWQKALPSLMQRMQAGERIALVSDAGTPLISDPGFRLVQECLAEGVPVFHLPGPCAAITALTLSGLPPFPFHFCGFLPSQATKRCLRLQQVSQVPGTLIFFESPRRLLCTLQKAREILGNRAAVIARELTKQFEEVQRGSLEDLAQACAERAPKGEIVLLVAGASEQTPAGDPQEVLTRHLATLSLKEAVRAAHQETGCAKSQLYRDALRIKGRS
ncbi:MAG: 16S rRNA (cytidine(1402)-2'-O)-methyltransferase [Holosporales bacterium]|jgi:16S rRNA (cytidine1402-2'-O)-methyltransferase|nr:16S rRNA (cytidine(1402)-2'-O)-methyltransferase [Holosporales bacterium]